jgi:zinc and cadmium transporter
MTLLLILGASAIGGVVAVLLASTVLLPKDPRVGKLIPKLVSFSTGTLLGAAFLGMIPHAAATLSVHTLSSAVLVSLVAFFILEKLLVWRHCHRTECGFHASSGPLLLIGDAFHNFVDGLVLAGAFLDSNSLGVAAAVSTVTHEIPQEVGEFMVYVRAGYSRRRALTLNIMTSLTTIVGGLLGYFFLSSMLSARPYILVVAAAGFIYVALADLVPAQRQGASLRTTALEFVFVMAGIGGIAAVAFGWEP